MRACVHMVEPTNLTSPLSPSISGARLPEINSKISHYGHAHRSPSPNPQSPSIRRFPPAFAPVCPRPPRPRAPPNRRRISGGVLPSAESLTGFPAVWSCFSLLRAGDLSAISAPTTSLDCPGSGFRQRRGCGWSAVGASRHWIGPDKRGWWAVVRWVGRP